MQTKYWFIIRKAFAAETTTKKREREKLLKISLVDDLYYIYNLESFFINAMADKSKIIFIVMYIVHSVFI